MPELPEVETVRRGLEPLVLGRRAVEAFGHPSPKFRSATQVIGAQVISVDRRGKYLLFGLDDGRTMVAHLGMTGQFLHEAEPLPDPGPAADPYVRAWWAFDDGSLLRYRDVRRFGRIAVVSGHPTGLATLDALGPEPFDPAFDGDHLWRALHASKVKVKTQLLNQRVVAGVGNIYADEALWRAQVHPASRRVSRPAARRLAEAVTEVLAEGIEHGGTTLRDYRTVSGDQGDNQHRLDCYGRSGAPCRRCGATLRRTVVDGRGTTVCTACQKR